jgi:hypothetical protein
VPPSPQTLSDQQLLAAAGATPPLDTSQARGIRQTAPGVFQDANGNTYTPAAAAAPGYFRDAQGNLLRDTSYSPAAPPPTPAPAASQNGSPPPTSLSDQQLMAIHANGQPMSPAEDWGRSAVTGLEKGATGLLGMPKALSEGSDWLNQRAADGMAYMMGAPPLTPQERQTVTDVGHSIQAGGAPMFAPEGPSAEQMNQWVQGVAGPYHVPQTTAGRYIETAGEMVPSALMPVGDVGLAAKAATMAGRVAFPAFGAQGASDLAPDDLKPYAQIAGGVLGGGFQGALESLGRAPAAALARSLPAQLDAETAAQIGALRDSAGQQGISLTIPEAIAQVTGNTGATNLQRTLENSARLRPTLSPWFAQRPGQVQGAVDDFVGEVAPNMPSRPSTIGLQAQGAAQGTLDDTRLTINAYAHPYYQNLSGTAQPQQMATDFGMVDLPTKYTFGPGNMIPTNAYSKLSGTPAYQEALDQVRGDPLLNAGIAHLPDSDVGVVNEVTKQLDRNIEGYSQTQMNPGGNNYKSSQAQQARSLADALASEASPNFRTARQTVADGNKYLLDPLKAGPIGQIAATSDVPTQIGALYPRDPLVGSATETGDAATLLGAQDPDVARNLTGQHIGGAYNRSARALVSGPNEWGGAAFLRNIAGNPEQSEALNAGLVGIDPTGELAAKWGDLADALAATGKRQSAGSQTASYLENKDILHQAPGAIRFLGAVGDPLEWTKNLSNWTGGQLYGRNLDVLANMIRDPDTAAVLAKAKAATPTYGAMQLALPAATQNQGGSP